VRRRRSLALIGVGLAPLAGCAREKPDRRLRVPLGGMAVGARREVEHGEDVLEIVRTADGAVARSLLCPHYGCRVAWAADEHRYRCPCHGGTFDELGRPVAGPPPGPLRTLPVTVEGDTALVGEP
jgi:Rieske Fe-S protein